VRTRERYEYNNEKGRVKKEEAGEREEISRKGRVVASRPCTMHAVCALPVRRVVLGMTRSQSIAEHRDMEDYYCTASSKGY